MKLAPGSLLSVIGLMLATAGCGPTEPSGPSGLAAARAQAERRGTPVLIEFYADW